MRDFVELVKALQLCPNTCRGCPRLNTSEPFTECKAKLNRDAADAIEELLAKVPHWISVEERLPEPREKVLACACDDRHDYYKEVSFLLPNGAWLGGFEPTHWMPLPSTEGLK